MRRVNPAVLAVPLAASLAACGTTSIHFENDIFGAGDRNDRYYTSGLRVSSMFDAAATPEWLRTAASATPLYERGSTTQVGAIVAQEIYTPERIKLRRKLEDDRPYAGWLYAGLLVANASRRAGDDPVGDYASTFEVDVGVTGPKSFAEDAQKLVHDWTGSDRPRGWRHQGASEPGIVGTYEYRRRLVAGDAISEMDWDVLGKVGASLGTVHANAAGGLQARLGWRLPRDFGVNTIHTTAVEVPDDGERGSSPRWYLFAAADAKAVGRNAFLDGPLFHDGPDIDKEPLVGELRAGLALDFGRFRIAYTHVHRTDEFDGQDGGQRFGSLSVGWTWDF